MSDYIVRCLKEDNKALADECKLLDQQLTTERKKVGRLVEALEGMNSSSKKVIDQLIKTGCDDAWSICKLNDMLSEIDEALSEIKGEK